MKVLIIGILMIFIIGIYFLNINISNNNEPKYLLRDLLNSEKVFYIKELEINPSTIKLVDFMALTGIMTTGDIGVEGCIEDSCTAILRNIKESGYVSEYIYNVGDSVIGSESKMIVLSIWSDGVVLQIIPDGIGYLLIEINEDDEDMSGKYFDWYDK